MAKLKLFFVIGVEVDTDLSPEDAIDEIGSETDYNIGSTGNVKVVNTEISEVSESYPGE